MEKNISLSYNFLLYSARLGVTEDIIRLLLILNIGSLISAKQSIYKIYKLVHFCSNLPGTEIQKVCAGSLITNFH